MGFLVKPRPSHDFFWGFNMTAQPACLLFTKPFWLFSMLAVFGGAAPSEADAWEVIYSSDFSSDPGWTTNVPEQMFWDSASGRFYIESRAGANQQVYVSLPG